MAEESSTHITQRRKRAFLNDLQLMIDGLRYEKSSRSDALNFGREPTHLRDHVVYGRWRPFLEKAKELFPLLAFERPDAEFANTDDEIYYYQRLHHACRAAMSAEPTQPWLVDEIPETFIPELDECEVPNPVITLMRGVRLSSYSSAALSQYESSCRPPEPDNTDLGSSTPLHAPFEGRSAGVSSPAEAPSSDWPPDKGWHFRAGQAAYLGVAFKITDCQRIVLKELANRSDGRRSATELAEALKLRDPNGTAPESSTVRNHVSDVRTLLKTVFAIEPEGEDPIPVVARGTNNTAYMLNLTVLRKREGS